MEKYMSEPTTTTSDAFPGIPDPDVITFGERTYVRSDAELQAQLSATNLRTAELEAQLARLRRDRDDIQNTLQQFQTEVRDVAIRVAEEQDWCDEGLNKVLEELGLDPKSVPYRVTVRVFAYQDVEIEVDAISDEEAQAKVLDFDSGTADLWRETENGQWESTEMFGEGYELKSVQKLS